MHMESVKERAFWHIQKIPLAEGSLIRNLSFTEFTTKYYLLILSTTIC